MHREVPAKLNGEFLQKLIMRRQNTCELSELYQSSVTMLQDFMPLVSFVDEPGLEVFDGRLCDLDYCIDILEPGEPGCVAA